MEETRDEQEALQAKLQASEDRFRKIFHASPAIISISTLETGCHYDVNDNWLSVMGFSRDEVIGKDAQTLGVWPSMDDRARFIQAMQDNGGQLRGYEAQLRTKQGQILTFVANCDQIIYDGESRLMMVFHNITEHKELEARLEQKVKERTKELSEQVEQTQKAQDELLDHDAKLQQLNNMLRLVLDTIPVRVLWKDLNSVILGCNNLFALDVGLKNSRQAIGKTVAELVWKESAEQYRKTDMDVVESGVPLIGYTELEHRTNGPDRWINKSKLPLRNTDGNIIGVLVVYEDITAQKQAQEDLENAKKRAENANLAKSQFLSSMSHELRTPLNAILGFAQFLESDPIKPLDAEQLECLGHIKSGGNHLLDLINEILELAKIESGHLTLEMESLDLVEIFYDTVPLIQAQAEKANVKLLMPALETSCPYIWADFKRTKQVLLNLLTNAVKYNVEGGRVILSSSFDEDFVTITVSDTGIGMSEEGQETLFTPFSRLGQESTTIEGTGIGLVITQDLVQLMKGEMGVESELGKGSTFWVRLPIDKPESPQQ